MFIVGNVQAGVSKCYVTTNTAKAAVSPYDTWDTAAHDLNTALEVGTDEIEVGEGTYVNTAARYVFDRAVKVYSSKGPAKTILQAKTTTSRQLEMTHADAFLSGFTLKDGKGNNSDGHAIAFSAGTISNCVMNGKISFVYRSYCHMSGSAKLLDCEIDASGFWQATTDSTCGLIWMEGNALVERCSVHGWSWKTGYHGSDYKSAVVLNSANAVLRNSLVYANQNGNVASADHRVANFNGGGVRLNSGTVENCTIVGNKSSNNGGGLYVSGSSGKVVNCIIWGNTAAGGVGADIYAPSLPAASIVSLCSANVGDSAALPNGTGADCTALDPKFSGADPRPYELTLDSVGCIDKGAETAASGAAGAVDLAGNPRLDWKNGLVDIGCYEYAPSHEKVPLSASIDVKVLESTCGSETVKFTATPTGDDTTGLSWCWHFGDGATDATTLTPTHTYVPGSFVASLALTNGVGEATNVVWKTPFVVIPQTAYVSKTGEGIYPYDSWQKATNDLNVVLAVKSPEVVVGDGTYVNTNGNYTLNRAVTVRSENGPAKTILQAKSNSQQFVITHADALLAGFTLQDGWGSNGTGPALSVSGGTVSNCVVQGDLNAVYACFSTFSGSSRVVDCTFDLSHFSRYASDSRIGMIWLTGNAVADRCKVFGWYFNGNYYSAKHFKVPIALDSSSASLRNSLVYGNRNASHDGGAIHIESGTVENCTVVNNWSTRFGGGIYAPNASGKIVNCIVWGNTTGQEHGTDVYAPNFASGNMTYSCASNLGDTVAMPAAGVGAGCISAYPKFSSRPSPWHLKSSSPAINAGTRLNWMTDGVQDLDGAPRILNSNPDMGCYECLRSGFAVILQ